MFTRLGLCLLTLMSLFAAGFGQSADGFFTLEERDQVLSYWNRPGRYIIQPDPSGPQLRWTVPGSIWFSKYNALRGVGKTPTTPVNPPSPAALAEWENWLQTKIAFDRGEALQPDPAPDSLVAAVGEPPRFVDSVQPNQYTVKFDEENVFTYVDNVPVKERNAYYRFAQGVISGGIVVKNLDGVDLDRLFEQAGITEPEGRIFKAVSLLEGGFDSVNTYDTGLVSVGLIQFACLNAGAGSLGSVLKSLKSDAAKAFNINFRRFGIDVTETGQLVALDPATGTVCVGRDAALCIIDDKRLIAVFQRAGRCCDPFRIAQLRVAKSQYLPADDPITLTFGGVQKEYKVRDVIRSEAGLATLMDLKVHTGRIDPLATYVNQCIADNGLKSINQLLDYERDIVLQMQHRRDFLADMTLTHPRNIGSAASRGGKPKRKGGG